LGCSGCEGAAVDRELTEDEVKEMCHFLLLDGSGLRRLLYNEVVERAYREWLETLCEHDFEPVLRRKKINAMNPQIVKICQECAFQFGGPVSHKDAPALDAIPWLSSFTHRHYREQRLAVWRSTQNELYQDYSNRQILQSMSYAEYLESDAWKALRAKVLKRASHICEGCGTAEAVQAHHLRYAHIGHEFLWELVAVCLECHERVHPEKHKTDRFHD
jgi:5-methylcytosine-specific restriction endonuclease McrA